MKKSMKLLVLVFLQVTFSHADDSLVYYNEDPIRHNKAIASSAKIGFLGQDFYVISDSKKLEIKKILGVNANAAGSAVIWASSKVANNAIQGKGLACGIGRAALINGGLGATGSLFSSAGQAGQNTLARSAWSKVPIKDKLMTTTIQSTSNLSGVIVGGANAVGNALCNSSPIVEKMDE